MNPNPTPTQSIAPKPTRHNSHFKLHHWWWFIQGSFSINFITHISIFTVHIYETHSHTHEIIINNCVRRSWDVCLCDFFSLVFYSFIIHDGLKWCMCAVLWLHFAPSYYHHHEPSIFNYIRYCLKWMFSFSFAFPSFPSHLHKHSLRFSHSFNLVHDYAANFYWKYNTSRCNVLSMPPRQPSFCSKCICIDFIWYIYWM